MTLGVIGKKLGMTQIYDEAGLCIPVTVVAVEEAVVTQVKTTETDGYEAIQVGVVAAKEKHLTKAQIGHFKKNNLKPKYRTLLAFPLYEEIGHGGSYVPPEVSEYVAIDIGLIGPDCHANERNVSICTKDAFSPYDRGLTNKIIALAKKANVNYCLDVFYHYGTDANAAIRAGHNVYTAAFGMACLNSHGKERCHISAIEDTAKLAIAYALDI